MRRPEEALQRVLVQHLRLRLPRTWVVFHVPNGGGRSKAEAGALKAMGVLAGVPDLFVIGPKHTVIALELKAPPKPGSKAKPRVSDAQRDVIATLGQCGIPTIIVRSLDEALAALIELGVPINGRLM